MSGKDFFEKLAALGYLEYIKANKISESLKPNEKSLDWLFAFPKINQLLLWLLKDFSADCFLTFDELRSFNNLKSVFSFEKIQEIRELIEPEPYESESTEKETETLESQLKEILTEQELEIEQLELALEDNNSEIDAKTLELGVQTENEALEQEVLMHLNSFTDICPVVSLSVLQGFVKLDEEISQNITNYAKLIELCTNAVDGSFFQQCLRSKRGQEFANLCQERKSLEVLSLKTHKQLLLANAAFEKYKAALKTFEALILKDDKIKKSNLDASINSNKEQTEDLSSKVAAIAFEIDKVTQAIEEINSESIEFENIDLLIKKSEFSSIKLLEISKMLEKQKKLSFVALAGIILEQEAIQKEYDRLFSIQDLFEDLNSQIEFRIGCYKKYKLKAESLSEERKTIDERDELMNGIQRALESEEKKILSFEDLTGRLEWVVSKARDNMIRHCKCVDKFCEECSRLAAEFIREADALIGGIPNEDKQIETERVAREVDSVVKKIAGLLGNFDDLHKETIISNAGTSEREIYVQFLTSKMPAFLNECDLIK